MDSLSDTELLRDYAERRSEAAFAELVRRHLDLVYSAALRMMSDRALAEDVTQAAFLALAQNARRLTRHPVLSGWLHQTARNIAANTVRSDVRRRVREQEAAAMSEMLAAEPEVPWDQIAPHLDAGLGELNDHERDALLLRYFEGKTAREIAQTLGISDEAAQKRVTRALEHLRGFLARRGVSAGAAALAVAITAHGVQAAPAALATTISAAAATAVVPTAITATKIIAMTTLQKGLIAAVFVAAVGAGIYQARQTAAARQEAQAAQQQQTVLNRQIEQLQRERDDASNRLLAARAELARVQTAQNPAELLKLRGQVGSLQKQLATTGSNEPASGFAKMMSDPAMRDYVKQAMVDLIKRRYASLFQELKLTPEQTQQFVDLVNEEFQQGAQRLIAAQAQPGAVPTPGSGADERPNLTAKLKELLGDSGAARFAEYTREVPARTTVDLLDTQLGGSKLTEEQKTRLFQLVKAEPFNLTHGISGDLDQAFFGSQTEVDDYLSKISESNQRVLQGAGEFLNPEQVTALNTVLANGVTARVTQAAALTKKQ